MASSLQLRLAALTDVGKVRAANEDNHGHAEYPWGQIFVVCDGMGGHVGGAKASHIAVTSILEYMARDTAENPRTSLQKAISFANEQIFATALNQRELKGMGTTCVMLLQKETGLWLAHVGDSRAYIFSDGKLHKLSRDHSYVQKLVDHGAIAEEDAEIHPRKNELTRALGIHEEVEVEVAADPIFPRTGDVFVLCSDGLNGMIGDIGIQKVVGGEGGLEEKAQLLIDEANAAGGNDNITVHLIQVTDSPHVVNRFTPIKPLAHQGRTMPLEEAVTESPPLTQPKRPPFHKRYMIPLLFGAVFLLAAGIFAVGWWREAEAAKIKADRDQYVKDSTLQAQDSLAQLKADSIATREKFVKDSTQRAEDSIAHMKKGGRQK